MEIALSGGAPLGIIECRYAVNTNSAGASISADTWTALAITEFLDTGSHCSVSGGIMTLSSGTYRAVISSTSFVSTATQISLRLQNISDTLTPIKVPLCYAHTLASGYPLQPIGTYGLFVIGASKDFQLEVLYEAAVTMGAVASTALNDPNGNLLAKVYLEKLA